MRNTTWAYDINGQHYMADNAIDLAQRRVLFLALLTHGQPDGRITCNHIKLHTYHSTGRSAHSLQMVAHQCIGAPGPTVAVHISNTDMGSQHDRD